MPARKGHPNPRKGTSKYDFLLAMQPGESYSFDNMPTPSEGRRKVAPTSRKAYFRVSSGVGILHRIQKQCRMGVVVHTTPGSRIQGDKIIVTMLSVNGEVANADDFEAHEKRSKLMLEAWIKRRQQEDAPKLAGQIEEARALETVRQVSSAVKRQVQEAGCRVVINNAPKYDPIKLAGLVAHFTQGGGIQRQLFNPDGTPSHWVDEPSPTWVLPTAHYRKKPRIRDFYLIVGRAGDVTAAATDPTKLPHHDPACLIHAREVLPEEE